MTNESYNYVHKIINNKHQAKILVNSGAYESCIAEDYAKELGLGIIPPELNRAKCFTTADKIIIWALGTVNITVNIAGVKLSHQLNVLAICAAGILLGIHFFRLHSVNLDFGNHKLL